MADTNDQQRARRLKPAKGNTGSPPGKLELAAPRLVAATDGKTHNVVRLATWFELRLLSAHGKPIVGEVCQMFDPTGKIVEKKTDKDGVVRFNDLPVVPPPDTNWEDSSSPPVVFPNVLEEWVKGPLGAFGKHSGARDDYRKRDGTVHFVPALETRTDIQLNVLAMEQKLQHFIDAYVDNGAIYEAASPRVHSKSDQRWNWGKGSVCNQHINFFLGYMFNFNDNFTTAGSATVMSVLPLFDSKIHTFGSIKHRGYLDYLTPVTGLGDAFDDAYNPGEPDTWPTDEHWQKTFRSIEYIRLGTYFDYATKAPFAPFIDALGPINVYSLSDIKHPKVKDAEAAIRAWMKKHKAAGETEATIAAKPTSALWEKAFDLDDEDAKDAELIRTLKDMVTWDHHAGILLVREKGGGPLTSSSTEKELWTFSADGAHTPGPKIVFKTFAESDVQRHFAHVGIWKLKELAVGGFAPSSAGENEGKVSIDLPPRFIHWG